MKEKIEKIFRLKNPIVKKVLSAVAVAGFGFILLNLTFLFDFLFQSVVDAFVSLLTPVNFNMAWYWFPPVKHAMFVIIIGLISWLIFKSKLGVLYKAIYMTVPLAVIFVTLGMFLFSQPTAALLLGSLFCICVLYYFYRTKQPWLYYYTVILVGLVLAIFSLTGGEI